MHLVFIRHSVRALHAVGDGSSGTFTGNKANGTGEDGKGGFLYMAPSSALTISGAVTVSGNTAQVGSAVYLDGTASMTMSNGTITNNTTSNTQSGAVHADQGEGAVTFSGNPKILDNLTGHNLYADETDQNVEKIRTTGSGLSGSAEIHVYSDGRLEAGIQFGTGTGSSSMMNLDRFINESNGLRGTKGVGDDQIIWRGHDLTVEKKVTGEGNPPEAGFTVTVERTGTVLTDGSKYEVTGLSGISSVTVADGKITVTGIQNKTKFSVKNLPNGIYKIKELNKDGYELTYLLAGETHESAAEGEDLNEITVSLNVISSAGIPNARSVELHNCITHRMSSFIRHLRASGPIMPRICSCCCLACWFCC